MRRTTASLIGIAICTATLIQAASRGNEPRTPTTVGTFMVQVATAIDGQPRTLDTARETLRRLGAGGAFDASATLTEGVIARLVADLGVAMGSTGNPAAPVSAVRSAAVASHLGAVLEGRKVSGDQLPSQCLTSVNRGACVNCCKETGVAANECAAFCHNNVPSVSEEEPNP